MLMTLPDIAPAGKRVNRWWLYGPYLALLIVIVAWSGAWFWIRGRVEGDLAAAKARGQLGVAALSWDRARVGGFPFRIELVLDGVRLTAPSGWGVSAPQVRAETYAYDLKRWVAYAPNGMVLARPRGGPVAVSGQAIRASAALEGEGQDRFAFEGLKLTFTPQAGGEAFPLLSADTIDLHTRPAGPTDAVEFLLQVQGARLPATTPLGRIIADAPLSTAWHGTLSKASALSGRDWPDAARAWAGARGTIAVLGADLDAGPLHLNASGGELSVGTDGRLRGGLTLNLSRLPDTLSALGRAGLIEPATAQGAAGIARTRAAAEPTASAPLGFQAGAATLGPLRIGPAPRVF
jgi:hypothetical protein